MRFYLFKLLAIAAVLSPVYSTLFEVTEGQVQGRGIICPQAIPPAAERPTESQRQDGSKLFARACQADMISCREDRDCFEFNCSYCATLRTPSGNYTRCR